MLLCLGDQSSRIVLETGLFGTDILQFAMRDRQLHLIELASDVNSISESFNSRYHIELKFCECIFAVRRNTYKFYSLNKVTIKKLEHFENTANLMSRFSLPLVENDNWIVQYRESI